MKSLLVAALAFAQGLATSLSAQGASDWTEPMAAHHVAGNLYYVGSRGLASYLVTTPNGHVLINSSLEKSVPLIRQSVQSLGFNFADIKILLISHAHWDHCAGSAAILKQTGAAYMVMDGDVEVVESGGKRDFHYGELEATHFPPARVDRILHEGDQVTLGGSTLVARKTPGHTKGCTTWTMKVREKDVVLEAVILGSPNVNPGYKLVNNSTYPGIAKDYESMFLLLKSLPCDLFLGAHGDYYQMGSKLETMKTGARNPFIDPEGYKQYVASKEKAFLTELKKQQR